MLSFYSSSIKFCQFSFSHSLVLSPLLFASNLDCFPAPAIGTALIEATASRLLIADIQNLRVKLRSCVWIGP